MSGQAVLYAAKSTEDIHGSIPTQLEDGRKLAEREGLKVVGEYADEAASAYNGDRGPELAAALEHAQRIGASLIVQHSDRLARGDGIQARHLGELYFASYKTGMTLRSVQDDSTFQNPILAVVMGERNMEDSRRTSMAVKAGLERRRERGLYSAGHTPFGYQRVRNEDDERILVIDEGRAPWVRRLFDFYLEGKGYADIARTLEAEGVPSPKGGGLWCHYTVRKILFNPVYTGLIRSGGKLWEGSHEPIIDRETWDKAVALREAKARTHKRGRSPVGKHLFRKGFLKCGICGEPMSPLTYRERPHPTDQIYRCLGRKRHSHTCDMSTVYRSDLDGAVYAYFRDLGGDAESTRQQLATARELELFMERELLRSAEEGVGAAKGRLERVKRDYLSGQLSAAEWQELRAELEPALASAQAEAERLRGEIKETENESTHSKLSTELLGLLSKIRAEIAKEVVDSKEAAAIRAALMRLFDGFVLHRGSPGAQTGEGTKVAYWLEPVLGQHQMGGYVDRLREKTVPTGSAFPIGEAENNCAFSAGRVGSGSPPAPGGGSAPPRPRSTMTSLRAAPASESAGARCCARGRWRADSGSRRSSRPCRTRGRFEGAARGLRPPGTPRSHRRTRAAE